MSESSLWTYVRGKLLPPGIHATRIENGVSAGFPDVHYTFTPDITGLNGWGRSGTLELKFLRKANLPFGSQGLNRDQRFWIRDEIEAGGTNYIIAQVKKRIFVVGGCHWEKFNDLDSTGMERWAVLAIEHGKLTQEIRDRFAALL